MLIRKLKEVRSELKQLNDSLQHNGLMLNTPPQIVEGSCCASALRCFQENLLKLNVTNKKIQRKLVKSLKSLHLTESGLNFCDSGNATTTCQTCNSYPKNSTKDFVDTLDSLIQMGLTRLMS
ncbi:interleukin-21 isoform X2 [Centroberyx affinis]|uniref:interleukin-21 isoform X2 n=1 Tax=Centroberyx affinis TaxID=166261 RepID=UPI003A5C10C3